MSEWAFVFVKFSQWRLVPRFARRGREFQFQWLFLYVQRAIV